ncbi:ligase-associated DNA damage response exonuclease [Sulfitobacter sp. M57]|uniref:ligase-associated DNA damage response exonuclease n=1 Tax=unclassified Sulfitobacter TaxID=196795 RepID=UPI0023E3168B|nr:MULTISPECIES: ligase-associated DNA damage response exonuclease [unclassified Sulfitobacter]MDF3413176.1 ligase-associated DNA damage response exonuclease [Sulfitobacter sp. KE5]MDF3421541.1 ligase-associated DNA damage response exonuclease [Sulfitobacter sp. KE43]MDF3431725.1 ligase-associated DNA damage response exonuclease [Sulfitobacter sp. KE42]MDF3457366.1 ligase-associated DNA damage response exonuclease [Sulfitobacter sp. S74]MDF3461268.1 ligase-associated DNA damage response exonuc
MTRAPILSFTDKGIYCAAGDFYVDPWYPVARALITHGHADHARPGMGTYLATDGTLPIMRHRLGDISAESIAYGQVIRIGDAQVSFHPAGHVPGSAQIRIEVGGEIWVASGDYKITDDGLSEPFEPVPCHHFITESTFGLPVFRWAEQATVAAEINTWWSACAAAGKTAFLGAYALGKAQRLLSMLDPDIGPILTHTAVENSNRVLRGQGYTLPATRHASADLIPKNHPGAIVICPPSAMGSTWARRFGPQETGFASGWMAIRGIRRRRAGDRGFVISDHADWEGLLSAIKQTGAENIYVTHGYTDIFNKYLNENGWQSRVIPTQFEGETAGAEEQA